LMDKEKRSRWGSICSLLDLQFFWPVFFNFHSCSLGNYKI
jgi:hypothetical protein